MPRLFLGNLRYDVVSMDIESLFKPYGRLLAVNLKRCFGFVELSEDKNARRAIRELNGMRFMGDKYVYSIIHSFIHACMLHAHGFIVARSLSLLTPPISSTVCRTKVACGVC